MKKIQWFNYFLEVLCFSFLAVSLQAAPLKVLSSAPRGTDAASARQSVTLTFNQPVTALAEASQFSAEDCPLTITPSVAGICRYSGTQTLQFEPAEDWPEATQFVVQLKKGFTSRVSGQKLAVPHIFTFSTKTPQVRKLLPRNNEHWISLNPLFYVQFNMEVTPENIVKFATLQDASGQEVSLTARALTDVEWEQDFSNLPKNQQVVLSPVHPLTQGTHYTLTLRQGLKANKGPLGMQKNYTTHFFTYPELTVQGVKKEGCLPFTPGIRFSSPVRLRELVRAIKVSPQGVLPDSIDDNLDTLGSEIVINPGAKLGESLREMYRDDYALTEEEMNQGTAFFFMSLSFLKFPPNKPVQVTVSKNLRDIYGNKLGKDYTFEITNSGYCPSVEFSGGFGVLESYLKPRLPIELMNIASLPVQAARFNKDNFIPFDSKETRYCKKVDLQAPTYQGDYSFKSVQDKAIKTFFDLTSFKPTGQDSIIFTQVQLSRRNTEEECWVSSLSNITDVGVTFKTSPQSILVWTTSLKTGAPLPAMNVEIRDVSNTVLWTGSTDENGLALAPGWEKLVAKKPSWGQPKLYAFISSAGGDAVLSTELNNGLELWRLNIPFTYAAQRDILRTQLFTERGIYRPGEKVYVKGLSRFLTTQGWTYPTDMKGTLTLSNSRGEEVASKEIVLSNQGSFSEEFEIAKTAHTGEWELAFTPSLAGLSDPKTTYHTIRVETAKQADFEITLQADKTNYTSGMQAKLSAVALYNFGAPLTQAPAKWSVHRASAWFNPDSYDEYTFIPYFLREDEYKQNGKLLASINEKTNDKGATSFDVTLPEVTIPTDVFVEVGVQSPAKQDLFARKTVTVHPGDFYIGAKIKSNQLRAGKPLQADVIAVTPQGKRVPAHIVANIRKVQWYSVRKTGLSGRLEWVSEKQEIELPSQAFDITDKGGTFSFTPSEGGNYLITFSAKDEAGHTILGGLDVYVSGSADTYWSQNDEDILVLKQDKNSYKPGQRARVSVESPYEDALALVTVEREGILDAWITRVKKGEDYIDVPIKENYLPNVYVGVMLVRGRSADPVNDQGLDLGKPQGKIGYVALKVAPEKKRINVSLQTNQKKYRPGDEVTVKLTTKVNGKAIPAEVTVMVVDEGVLSLTNYQTPDPFDIFYRNIPLSVFTADNRPYVIGQRNFGEKGENRGGGGGAFKLGGADLRSHFSFVPYFNATVFTNAKGRGEVRFKLPDNLTKFRIMAVAASAADFGSASTSVQVAKPLMVTANLPRLARTGDEFNCGAIVYNYEDKKGELTVSAQATGALELTGTTQMVQVPLGEAKEVTWKCKALHPGSSQVAFRVQGKGKETDGMLTTLQVEPVEKLQTLMAYGVTENTQDELLDKPGSVSPTATNQVELSLASTALLQVKGALNYLISYPFECLEQQLSKSIPVIRGEALIKDFGLADVAAQKKKAQELFDRLEMYQASSGGFGYWENTFYADPYVTSYALEVAYLAKQQGYHVPEAVLKKAVEWLAKAFNNQTRLAYNYSFYETETTRAYAAYVLALYGKNTDALFNNLYSKYATLPVPALAYLLKEAHVSGRAESFKKTLSQRMINKAIHTPTSVYFSSSQAMPWLHVDDTTSTALALDALLTSQQPFEQAYKTVSWLLTQLNEQGCWASTQSNALAFVALNTYYKKQESVEPDFIAKVTQGTQTWQTASFKGRDARAYKQHIPFAKIYPQGTEAKLTFSKQGAGTLYYTLAQVYAPERYDRALSVGFDVSRQLTTLTGEPVTNVVAGERYQITLTVRTSAPRYFVVLEDFVPAGFEIVNTQLATESKQLNNDLREANQSSYFFRAEKYDGHLAAFADYLPAGTYTYSYAVSALASGTFSWPSAWVSQMYDPAVFGRNATSSLTIK